jgi:hypothetical protein
MNLFRLQLFTAVLLLVMVANPAFADVSPEAANQETQRRLELQQLKVETTKWRKSCDSSVVQCFQASKIYARALGEIIRRHAQMRGNGGGPVAPDHGGVATRPDPRGSGAGDGGGGGKIVDDIGSIIGDLGKYDEKSACADLDVGKSRMPWFTNAYRIARKSEKEYIAFFNTVYEPTQVTPEEAEQFRERVKQCFAKTVLKNENGETLRLALVKADSQGPQDIALTHIRLMKNIRSNSLNYDITIECKTIIHETLHLTGLPDEYHEDPYNCRSEADTVMSKQYEFDQSEFGFIKNVASSEQYGPGTTAVEYALARSESDEAFVPVESVKCNGPLEGDERSIAPEGKDLKYDFSERKGKFITGASWSKVGHFWTTPGLGENIYVPKSVADSPEQSEFLKEMLRVPVDPKWTCSVVKKTDGPEVPLRSVLNKHIYPLRAAHFRKIIFPSCVSRNEKYDRCTSQNEMKKVPGTCAKDAFPYCKTDSWLD